MCKLTNSVISYTVAKEYVLDNFMGKVSTRSTGFSSRSPLLRIDNNLPQLGQIDQQEVLPFFINRRHIGRVARHVSTGARRNPQSVLLGDLDSPLNTLVVRLGRSNNGKWQSSGREFGGEDEVVESLEGSIVGVLVALGSELDLGGCEGERRGGEGLCELVLGGGVHGCGGGGGEGGHDGEDTDGDLHDNSVRSKEKKGKKEGREDLHKNVGKRDGACIDGSTCVCDGLSEGTETNYQTSELQG